MNTYTYLVFGLTISIPFPCSTLTAVSPADAPDILVQMGSVPKLLENPAVTDPNWHVEPGRYLFLGDDRMGRFLAEGGNHVTVETQPGVDETIQASVFLEYVLAALLRQRGYLILHANTALTPHGAVSISGISGTGKSTALSALLQAGCRMLSDDITAARLHPNGMVEIIPGIPHMKLTDDSAHKLGIDTSLYPRQSWQKTKTIVSTQSYMEESPAVMQALYILSVGNVETVQLKPLYGREKLFSVQDCIYGPMLPGEHNTAFPILTILLEKVPVYRLDRPDKKWTIPELTRILLSTDPS